MIMAKKLTRRTAITTLASAATVVPGGSRPARAAEPDPVFAAIERHRAFLVEAGAVRRHRADWENRLIVASRRDGNRVHFNKIRQHPEYPARQAREEAIAERWDREKLMLLQAAPTTPAGLAALAAHLLDAHRHHDLTFSTEGDTDELLAMFDRAARNLTTDT